jgi:ABC-2 type transport system permease protein
MNTAATPMPIRETISSDDESAAFWRLRFRLVRTQVRQTMLAARFRAALILALSAVLWCGLFWIFKSGFEYLRMEIAHPETHDRLVQAIFSTFFAALLLMLVFSAAIILYGSLFRSSETMFLLTLPTRTEQVFLHRFQEAVVFSSWGFLLLGSPLLLAYAIVAHAPWYYYVMLAPYLLAFVYIPCGVGAILCLLLNYCVPQNRGWVLGGFLLLLGAGVGWYTWSLSHGAESNLLTPTWFLELMGRLQLTEQRLLPNWWLSAGLIETARAEWLEGLLFLVVMIANALFCRQLAIWAAGRLLRPGFSALASSGKKIKRARAILIDRAVLKGCVFFPWPMRLLIVKDLRVFRRDPMQWSQSLIFLILLIFYFLNLRRFNYDMLYVGWMNMVSFLNLSVVGLLTSTFTTRFVYPMISLESQRFWLLGLTPLRRSTILWSKFFFAAGGAIIPCSSLIVLSDTMLNISLFTMASHQLTCLLLCVGLAGISVGLGAMLPNLREQSPSRIAAGFGGTLCLVASTLYILIVVMLTALPTHFILAAEATYGGQYLIEHQSLRSYLHMWMTGGTVGSVVLGLIATTLPMGLGFRAFRRMEF